MYLNILLKLCLIFFDAISRKYKTWAIFDMLMTKTPRVNMIARQMTPFFSSLWYILFLHFRTFRIQFYGIPHSHYALILKIHLNAKDDISSLLNIYYFSIENLLYRIFWYIAFLIPNLILIRPQSHGLLLPI